MIERIRYYIREGFKNIWYNRMMSFASICVLTICLLLLGTSILLSLNISNLMTSVEKENQVAVFLKDGLSQETMDKVGTEIKSLSGVEKIQFVSSKQALQNEKKQLGKDASLLSGLGSDFLPNSYTVTLTDMNHFSAVVSEIKKMKNVDSVNEHSDVAKKLNSISSAVKWVGLWLFVLLAAVSLFIIVYTIKLAVYVRRREVNIMKFVGATDWFIRWPFFVEGVLIGIFSGAVATVLQWYLYGGLIKHLFVSLRIINPVAYSTVALPLSLGFVGSGIVLGVVGSLISVRKYLTV